MVNRNGIEIRSLINWLKLFFKKGYWDWWWLLKYGFLWIKPAKQPTSKNSGIFDINEISSTRKKIIEMGKKYPLWWPRIFEPETLGIRAWEYGKLLAGIDNFENKKFLDVGTGGSRLPEYLTSLGAKVTCLDIENPLEKSSEIINMVYGSMTKLQFTDNSFDVVICISALEHLDMKDGYGKTYKKDEYYRRAIKSVEEMKRVTKKGGWLYLTTDFFLPCQKSDNWPLSINKIRGAFEWERLNKCAKLLEVDINDWRSILEKDKNRANYRGRFFTTACFWWQKDY